MSADETARRDPLPALPGDRQGGLQPGRHRAAGRPARGAAAPGGSRRAPTRRRGGARASAEPAPPRPETFVERDRVRASIEGRLRPIRRRCRPLPARWPLVACCLPLAVPAAAHADARPRPTSRRRPAETVGNGDDVVGPGDNDPHRLERSRRRRALSDAERHALHADARRHRSSRHRRLHATPRPAGSRSNFTPFEVAARRRPALRREHLVRARARADGRRQDSVTLHASRPAHAARSRRNDGAGAAPSPTTAATRRPARPRRRRPRQGAWRSAIGVAGAPAARRPAHRARRPRRAPSRSSPRPARSSGDDA